MADAGVAIKIGANATELVSVVDQVTKKLEQLKTKLAALPEGSKDFVKIQREFNKINKEYEKGIINAQRFASAQEKIGNTSPSLKPLADGAKQARTAVTSLALVAQDLPFGFIGIQNNLPGVIQSFGDLKTKLNGTIPALKSIASSLVGPSGLFLAFSVVTSVITFAIQKYGSLSAAVDALFGNQTKLNERIKSASDSLSDYNKELRTNADIQANVFASQSGNIEKIQSLSKIVQNLSLSEQQRGNALKELQKIDKDYFGNISLAAGDVDKLRKATDLYTESLIRQATIKAFEEQITDVQKQINQQNILKESLKEQLKEAEKVKAANERARAITEKQGYAVVGVVDPTVKLNKRLAEQDTILKDLNNSRERFNEGLRETIKLQTKAFQPEFVPPPKADNFRGIILQQDSDMSLAKTTTDRLQLLNVVLANIRLNAINAADALRLLLGAQRQRRVEGDKELREGFKKIDGKAPGILPGPAVLQNIQNLKKLQEAYRVTGDILKQVFFEPLTNAFEELFEKGKVNFQKFGDAILKSVQQLVSKIIASGIVNLIFEIATGGFGASKGGAAGAFSRVLKNIFPGIGGNGGAGASANFSGVQGGQLGFGGSVALTLRGSDLVGALNRTNTTISRVG